MSFSLFLRGEKVKATSWKWAMAEEFDWWQEGDKRSNKNAASQDTRDR